MPTDLVIFDCDGVLVDSERLTVEIESRLITSLGWPLSTTEVVQRFLGRSDAYMLSQIEAALGRAVPEWTELLERERESVFRAELQPVNGIVDLLDSLTVASCVASSGTHEKLNLTLGLTGLLERFGEQIYSATEVEHGKPAPDLFLHAATQMGVDPARCLVVEDSPSGVQAALAAGMRCVAYASPMIPIEQLEQFDTPIVHDIGDVLLHI